MLSDWIRPTRGGPAVAAAYLLQIDEPYPHLVARISMCAQWQHRARGDGVGAHKVGAHKIGLFIERSFAESGPGVYPAPIITMGKRTF